MRAPYQLATGALLALIGACTAPSPQSTIVEVDTILSSGRCDGQKAGLQWIGQAQLNQLQSRQFLRDPKQPKPAAANTTPAFKMLSISHGAQPTSGYKLELHRAEVDGAGSLQVYLQWHTPPADAMLAQVMTTPCLVLQLPPGEYQSVTAQDQNGPIGTIAR